MIAFVKGILESKSMTTCSIDVNGIGYEISMPASDISRLPNSGDPVVVHTWHVQREDSQQLFGFLQPSDRWLFKILLGVAKVGPKLALAVLSGLTQAQLEDIVMRQDAAMLSKIPGVGLKTAERLVLELKDKLEISQDTARAARPADRDAFAEALEALLTLGYSAAQARNALQKVAGQDLPAVQAGQDRVAEFVKKALKTL
ncbi:Holliday junction branch migration protein RuvA [bacterium]|nr:Holliday junction branch migration protein RuvA [bacterium]